MLACGILLWRLWRTGLWKIYPSFFFFLAIEVSRDCLLWALPVQRTVYGQAFVITGPLIWICNAIVLRELYSLVLRNYPGMVKLARGLLLPFVIVVVAVGALLALAALYLIVNPLPILSDYRLVELGVMLCMTIMLALILGLFVWFPIEVNLNIKAYFTGYAFYFCVKALALLAQTHQGGQVNHIASLAINAVFLVTVCYWLSKLSIQGEQTLELSGLARSPEERAELQQQLIRINSLLSGLEP